MTTDFDVIKTAFRVSAIARADALLERNYRVANQHYDKLVRIYQKMEHDTALANSLLIPLLEDPNIHVRTSAATYCLGLGLETKRVASVLADIGILDFEAKMTLKVWQQNGKLVFYQKGNEAKTNIQASVAPRYKLNSQEKLMAWQGSESVMLYYGEIMNGGHWQYFENYPKAKHDEVIKALRMFGATNYATILEKAINCRELSDEAIRDKQMTELDNSFCSLKPSLNVIVEQYLNDHEQD